MARDHLLVGFAQLQSADRLCQGEKERHAERKAGQSEEKHYPWEQQNSGHID